MKSKLLILLVGLLLVVPALAWGQALGDSIILESKTVAPGAGNAADTTAYLYVRLSITNVDSLTFVTYGGIQRTVAGGAYGSLARPRTFNGMINRLTTTLTGQSVFNVGQPPQTAGARYNSASPDSFLFAVGFDPADPTTIEPPNATRKALLVIKFDTVNAPLGQFELDSGRVVQSCAFTNTVPNDKKVNFLKGIITVSIPAVDNPPPGDNVNADPVTNCADYNFNPPPGCPANFTLVSPTGQGASITPSGDFNWCGECGGSYPVTIQNDCNGTVVNYTFTATFNPGPPNAICPPNDQVQAGSVYNGQALASSGVPPYTFSKVGATPVGLVVASTGAISWATTLADVGTHTVTVRVTDACQQTDECTFQIFVVLGGPFRLCIDTIKAFQGTDVEVSIRNLDDATDPLLDNGKSVGGFSFLISYDCACLQFLSARKGALLVQQRWEFFTFRFGAIGNGNCGSGCPSCLLRVVAIADVNNGANHPNLTRDNQGEWVVLKFRTTNDRTLAGQCCPISWFWFDCTDNTVSDSTGNVLWVVDSLYTSSGAPIDLATAFPSNVANCDQFSGGPGKPSPRKNIIFCNGHICLPTPEEIDDRGDLNLNGVGYEIADAVLYENYFIYGPGVLSPNPTFRQSQIAASDVNGDGLVLSVGDLIALIRVITGDANPLPRMNPAAGAVSIALAAAGSEWTLSANSASDLGGLYLKFRVEGSAGTPALTAAAEGMTVKTNLIGNELSVLIYSEAQGRMIAPNAGALFSMDVEGSMELVESEAADYYGIALPTLTRASALPTSFALSQNYPNPFNGKTSFVLSLPVASDYKVTIYNVTGQVVRTFEGSAGPGNKTIVWDGMDQNGKAVSSGIYFFRGAADKFTATVKGLYLK